MTTTTFRYCVGLLCCLVLGVGPGVVTAQSSMSTPDPLVYQLSDTSTVEFYPSTTFVSLDGKAEDVGGTVTVNPGRYSSSSVQARVLVRSMTTYNSWRDEDMYEFLQADTYPHVSYSSDTITVTDLTRFDTGYVLRADVQGEFSLRGRTRPQTLQVQTEITPDRFEARTEFSLDLRDFDLTPPSFLHVANVSPIVDVKLRLLANRLSTKETGELDRSTNLFDGFQSDVARSRLFDEFARFRTEAGVRGIP